LERRSSSGITSYLGTFLLALGFTLLPTYARCQTYFFRNFSIQDGLVQSTVRTLAVDRQGMLWLGTEGGLATFDGTRFKTISTRDGLPETNITQLLFDSKDRLWIGFESGKLGYLQNNRFYAVPLMDSKGVGRINHLFETKGKELAISTEAGGLILIDLTRTTPRLKKYWNSSNGLQENIIQSWLDPSGTWWLITDIGIKRILPKGGFEFYQPDGFPIYTYTGLAPDAKGNLWLSTQDHGVGRLNTKTGKVFFLDQEQGMPGSFANKLFFDKNGTLWVSFWGEGICSIDSSGGITRMNAANGLPGSKIWDFAEDAEGNLWMGMLDRGICSFRGKLVTHFSLRSSPGTEVVNCLLGDERESMWFGTNQGVIRFSDNSNQLTAKLEQPPDFPKSQVTALALATNGNVVAGFFQSGLAVYDGKSGALIQHWRLHQDLINCLAIDNRNRFWLGTNEGLVVLKSDGNADPIAGKLPRNLQMGKITQILIDAQRETIWVMAKASGVWVYKSDRWSQLDTRKLGKSPGLQQIGLSPNGDLILSTSNGALWRNEVKGMKLIRKPGELPSDYINLIKISRSTIWVGTNQGLSFAKGSAWRNIGKPEGFAELETKEGAGWIDPKNDVLWLGTVNGAVRIDLREAKSNPVLPTIRATTITILNETRPYEKQIKLGFAKNEITFQYEALSLTSPERIRYRYLLEGFDRYWHGPTTATSGIYTNLPPGDFTFWVQACNSDGTWSNPSKLTEITITPPIWKTWKFYIFLILLGSTMVYGYVRWRTARLRIDKNILEEQVQERTREIEKKNIALIEAGEALIYKNKEITDSIQYAKHIQEAILPSSAKFESTFPEAFVLYMPKDIVSGDFYWLAESMDPPVEESPSIEAAAIHKRAEHLNPSQKRLPSPNKVLLAVADCTGHGVPGAFMCMVGTSLLNQIIHTEKVFNPSIVLSLLDTGVQTLLKQHETETRDGMDIALTLIDRESGEIEFAGALRPMVIFRKQDDGSFAPESLSGEKFPVGGLMLQSDRTYKLQKVKLNPGDMMFMFSDGYPDQFGGPKGKKIMNKRFREILQDICTLSAAEQRQVLHSYFMEWKGNQEQVDDVLVVGIRF
jgi:ligand-binding sensor domain-containing protein/serine phosphatase RsbU (regulator of sigma subunit)